jgi:PAS domain S-box-containing protein
MDTKTIRVLSIEDNPGDARLIHVMLLGAHSLGWDMPRFALEHVNRLAAGLARLEDAAAGEGEPVDVVLTDLDLPDSQAWDTFATLHARFPHMPIVVLTGREDEALAVDTVRAGAEDYLYKREMNGSLLAHALLYAIERQRTKAALRKAQAALETRVKERTAELAHANDQLQEELAARQRTEERLRFQVHLMDQIRDSIVATDLEGRITYTNEANARALQTTPEQLIGQNVYDLGEDPERGATQQEIIDETLADGAWEGQVINYAQNGAERIWETRTWVVYDEHEEPKGMVGVSTDVTERRRREERIVYLNTVLQAIRDVNQLITQEPDRDRLLQRACENLVETLGFHTAWIALATSPRAISALYAAGFEQEDRSLMERWKREGLPRCAKTAFPKASGLASSRDTVVVIDVAKCRECPLAGKDECDIPYAYRTALVVPLKYRKKVYGVLTLSAPERFARDTEVHALVAEVAEDIAFALGRLETEAARERAETALRESERKYRTLVEHFPDGALFMFDQDLRYTLCGGQGLKAVGLRAESLIGRTIYEIFPPDKCAIIARHCRPVFQGQSSYYELSYHGNIYANWAVPITREDGSIDEGIVFTLDITERKRAETALRESEERLVLAVEGTGVGLWDWQVQTGELVVNARWAEMIGYTLEELAPISIETWMSLCHPDDLQRSEECLARHFTGETEQYKCELRMKHKHGGWVWMLDQGKVFMRDAEGRPLRMAGTHLDITERKEAERELTRYTEALQHSNEELQQFAYTVSHDLKSPLRMVKSYMYLLEEEYKGQLDTEADRFIRFAVDGAQRMEQLIDGLLTYARVDTQGGDLVPTDAGAVLERVLASLYFEIEEQGAQVTYDPLPTVLADVTQLAQVFQNLIGNALKFQPPARDEPPRIHIAAAPLHLGESRGQGTVWRFSVQDNGIGIAPEHADRLFGVFQRLHTAEEYEGTGIGLAICKKIVERHGGRIWVESEVGEGATFYFTLMNERGVNHHGL